MLFVHIIYIYIFFLLTINYGMDGPLTNYIFYTYYIL
jgi:hypothetical protein